MPAIRLEKGHDILKTSNRKVTHAMATDSLQFKPAPLKPIRRQYGPKCPGCGRVIPIGADDIAPDVHIVHFREKLRRDGYQVLPAYCVSPGCGCSIEAELHRVEFGEPDDILPTQVTFLVAVKPAKALSGQYRSLCNTGCHSASWCIHATGAENCAEGWSPLASKISS
jgi:hypothetical protein